jgi:Ser/Thr protein kinase RdoA (MazF antagonist)
MDERLLNRIAERYGLTSGDLAPLAGGHFARVYGFVKDGQAGVLRVIPPGSQLDLAAMAAVQEWQAFLADRGGPVCRPWRSLAGQLIERVATGEAEIITCASEKARGRLAEELPQSAWTPALFEALGRALGRCHQIATTYQPLDPALARPPWQAAGNCFNPLESLPRAEPWLLAKRARLLAELAELPKDRQSFGLAHLDLHFGNFFVADDPPQVTLFDFDDCAHGWYAMDLAMLLFDILVVYAGAEKEAFANGFLEHLLRGYLPEHPLGREWIERLPLFLKLLEIGLYIAVAPCAPADPAGWVGKFLAGEERRQRLAADAPYVALDFGAVCEHAQDYHLRFLHRLLDAPSDNRQRPSGDSW